MRLLHPWAVVLGLAAMTLPVLIHWLTRPRPIRYPLSTIRFVHEVLQQRRARHRLRDAWILMLRTLAVLLLAWAVGRPIAGKPAPLGATEGGCLARVVLLDVSQSMAAVSQGSTTLERARPLAAAQLTDQPGLRANLLLASSRVQPVFEELSANLPALQDELAHAQVRPERLDVQAAVNRAAEMLAKSSQSTGQHRELIIFSDFQRSNWATVDFSVLPADTHIQLESVAAGRAPANLAILQVAAQGRPEQGRDLHLEVEVGNYSETARQVQVEVSLGEARYRLNGLCPPGIGTVLSTDVPLQAVGWLQGNVRLLDVADALAADDVRPLVLEVRAAPTYALITRQPADLRPSSSYYLERALAPMTPRPGRPAERVVRLDPVRVDEEALAGAEILIVDHPGRLAADVLQRVANLVRRGRGLFYVAAEPSDATNLQLFGQAAGAELQLPVEFLLPPAGQRRRELFLTEVRRQEPPFRVFGENLSSLLDVLRFSGGLASRRREGGLAEEIVATYSDRSACLVISSCGAGSVAVLNADLAASTLHNSPAFVPLVNELIGRLLARSRLGEAKACGEPLVVTLPTHVGTATGLQATGPDAAGAAASTFAPDGSNVLWRVPALGKPGVYLVQRDAQPLYAVAVATPPEESDLRPLEAEVFEGRLAGSRSVQFRAVVGMEEEKDSLWTWLVAGCVLCLCGEILSLKYFRT